MKLFFDRNKTLLPRVDKIYLIARGMVLLSLVWVVFFSQFESAHDIIFNIVLGTYFIHLIIFYMATASKFDIKLAYLSTIIYDLVFIPLLIMSTGEIHSSYFLLYLLTVSVAAYVLTNIFSFSILLLVTFSYLFSVSQSFQLNDLLNVTLNIGFFWVYFVAIVYASEFMHKSEKRLLKLLDTLNMRTSELEKNQAHLELIYENSRVLASILDTDSVVSELMNLLGRLLRFEGYAVIFQDADDRFYYRARFQNKQNNFQIEALPEFAVELLDKIGKQNSTIMIKDVTKRDDYKLLNKNSRSVMIVPMTAHDDLRGIIIAEASKAGAFKDKDLQMLSAVARSAALALENAELHKQTEALTVTDGLTSTYNYRYFARKLEEEKRRASRYSLALSLIMIDIDFFKKLNDTHGHESGNLVLVGLAGIIKECVRDVDIFARYGGEEFAIILPQTPLKDALVIGERIRQQVSEFPFKSDKGVELKVTVSVGLSSYPENGRSHEELVSLADQAMYRAKDNGRNLVCTN